MVGQLIAWILCGVAAATAVVLAFRLQAAASGRGAATARVDLLEKELAATRQQFEKKEGGQRRLREELQQARKKLDKAKKRAARAIGEQHDESSRIRELERDLELRAAELRAVRQERDAIEAGTVVSVPSPVPVPTPAPKVAKVEPPSESAELAALSARAETAERAEVEQAAELATVRRDVVRLRERVRTQDKLYLAIHGELEVKKDRIRQQIEELERLRSFKVAVFDPPPEELAEPATPSGPAPTDS